MWTCIACNKKNSNDDDFCIECGAPKPKPSKNHCSNPKCKAYAVILDYEQTHCGKCGALTTYGKSIDELI